MGGGGGGKLCSDDINTDSIYVGRKVWICAIRGLRCEKPWIRTSCKNSWISCAFHGSRVSKGAKYKSMDNPWIALRKQLIA